MLLTLMAHCEGVHCSHFTDEELGAWGVFLDLPEILPGRGGKGARISAMQERTLSSGTCPGQWRISIVPLLESPHRGVG